jgi:hypothetical protein
LLWPKLETTSSLHIMSNDVQLIITIIAGLTGLLAAWYAYYPYRSQRHDTVRARFVRERRYLSDHRPELTQSALRHHSALRDDTLPGMLTRTAWVALRPFPLEELAVSLDLSASPPGAATKVRRTARSTLPRSEAFRPYEGYSQALGELSRPVLFDDRSCYRLLSAQLSGESPELRVGMTSFFASVDESEALAHEYARQVMRGRSGMLRRRALRIREDLPDPFDVDSRTVIFSISSLTLRLEHGEATFFLHSRDSRAVAIASNLLHLAPSGIFQPTADHVEAITRDCSPWLTLCREYAEEFLGVEEARGESGLALSYEYDEPFAAINAAYAQGDLRVVVCGMGLDPLTFCPELVTLSYMEDAVFDQIFAELVIRNEEGYIQGSRTREGRVRGFALERETVQDLLESERLSPAAYAAISVASRYRDELAAREL